jgi:hypothetical protein
MSVCVVAVHCKHPQHYLVNVDPAPPKAHKCTLNSSPHLLRFYTQKHFGSPSTSPRKKKLVVTIRSYTAISVRKDICQGVD